MAKDQKSGRVDFRARLLSLSQSNRQPFDLLVTIMLYWSGRIGPAALAHYRCLARVGNGQERTLRLHALDGAIRPTLFAAHKTPQ